MLNNKSKPRKTLLSLFTKVNDGQPSNGTSSMCNIGASSSSPKFQRVEFEKTLLSLFTKVNDSQPSNGTSSMCNIDASSSSPKFQRVEFEKVDTPSTIDTPFLERDSGLRFSISTFLIDKREDVRWHI